MKTLWRIPDILDLEYLLGQDEDTDPAELARRDRGIYLEFIGPQDGDSRPEPGVLLHRWLQIRRRMAKEEGGAGTILPGRLWEEIYSLLRFLAMLAGLVAGGGLAYSFLAYSGTRPVNVALYLGTFVVTQQCLLLLLATLALYRLLSGRGLRSSLLYSLLARLVTNLLVRLRGGLLRQLDAGRRLRLLAVLGHGSARLRSHGSLLLWPMFILVQLFAASFNTGVLAATLVKVVTADVAFGWQSTLQVSAGAVARLVRLLALPWSWFLPPGISYPSLARIEGSRMVLKDGIYHLATTDLVSWWPFLCLAVLFYGLLPRLALLLAGHLGLRRALARYRCDGPACSRLLHRMLAPGLRTGASGQGAQPAESSTAPGMRRTTAGSGPPDAGGWEERTAGLAESRRSVPRRAAPEQEERTPGHRPPAVPEPQPAPPAGSVEDRARYQASLLALVPDELHDQCPREILAELLPARTGAALAGMLRIGAEDEMAGELGLIRDLFGAEEAGGILVLQEAWQPPIREFLDFLARLCDLAGREGRIIVALVGRPEPGTIFTPVSALDLRIWHQSLAALGDPRLEVVEMVAP